MTNDAEKINEENSKQEIREEKKLDEREEERDEELDIATAVDKAQNALRKVIGNLFSHQYSLEIVKKNGSNTRYIVISSVVPDLGEERDYYFNKIDVETGKVIPPMRKGKLVNGEFIEKEIITKPEWEE